MKDNANHSPGTTTLPCPVRWDREPRDLAVVLGVIPPPAPEIESLADLKACPSCRPPELVEGLLHQGCKMLFAGTSKSCKSWSVLDLAMSVASGQPWWGRRCRQARVIYINFELPRWALCERADTLQAARPELIDADGMLDTWTLRGHSGDAAVLVPWLKDKLAFADYGLIILDPVYKLLGERDENSNGDIASLMNELDVLTRDTDAGLVIAHHFPKGDASGKEPMDRMSGAGAWARDPDSLVLMTPHEEKDAFTVSTVLRHMKPLPDFVVEWEYPLMRVAPDLNPKMLRSRGTRQKACTDREFHRRYITVTPKTATQIYQEGKADGLSEATVRRYLYRLRGEALVAHKGKLFWSKAAPAN